MVDAEVNKLNVKSRRLRNLQRSLLAHLDSDSHKKQALQKEKLEANKRLQEQKNLLIGRTLGSLAYLIFYNKLPFLLFEKAITVDGSREH